MSKALFEVCDLCDGSGRPKDEAIAARLPECACKGRGFLPNGLTDTQVAAMASKLDRVRREAPIHPDDRAPIWPDHNRLPADQRVLRDSSFARLVSLMEHLISGAEFTPTELREAVILAATRYEMRRPPEPIFLDSHGFLPRA